MKLERAWEKHSKHNIFATSSGVKKIITLVSFSVFVALSIYILIEIKHPDDFLKDFKSILWKVSLLWIVWKSSRIVNRNLHISFSLNHYSYLISIFAIAYASTITFLFNDVRISKWQELLPIIWYIIPIYGINILWTIVLVLIEKKSGPYAAYEKMLGLVKEFFVLGLVLISRFLVIDYLVYKEPFSFSDNIIMLGIIYIIFGLTFTIIAEMYKWYNFSKFQISKLRIKRKIDIWEAALKIGPISVWYIVTKMNFVFDTPTWIYLGMGIASLLLILLFKLNRSSSRGSSKFYTIILSSIILAMTIGRFALETWMNVDVYTLINIYLSWLVIILIINVFIDPKLPPGFAFIFNRVFSSMVVFYAIALWLLGETVHNNVLALPLNINEIMVVPWVVSTFALQTITIWSLLIVYTKIRTNTKKIIKYEKKDHKTQNEDRKVKHEK